MLTVSRLDVQYGRLRAVRDVSIDVREGQTVTLLGANGAGKSSVLRAICGLVPVSGTPIHFNGKPLRGIAADRRVALGIGTVPEGRELFQSLTVAENLRMGAYLRRDRAGIRRDLDWIYSFFPALGVKRSARASTLSGGQGQMLAIGRALMSNPRLLLLDEPSNGLAPNLVEDIFHLVGRIQQERGLSMLLVEQNANKALAVASYGYVLEAGELALEGPTSTLARNPRVRQLYLGG